MKDSIIESSAAVVVCVFRDKLFACWEIFNFCHMLIFFTINLISFQIIL